VLPLVFLMSGRQSFPKKKGFRGLLGLPATKPASQQTIGQPRFDNYGRHFRYTILIVSWAVIITMYIVALERASRKIEAVKLMVKCAWRRNRFQGAGYSQALSSATALLGDKVRALAHVTTAQQWLGAMWLRHETVSIALTYRSYTRFSSLLMV
jgi:hypothetical protein